jgi:hypothetical protein
MKDHEINVRPVRIGNNAIGNHVLRTPGKNNSDKCPPPFFQWGQ